MVLSVGLQLFWLRQHFVFWVQPPSTTVGTSLLSTVRRRCKVGVKYDPVPLDLWITLYGHLRHWPPHKTVDTKDFDSEPKSQVVPYTYHHHRNPVFAPWWTLKTLYIKQCRSCSRSLGPSSLLGEVSDLDVFFRSLLLYFVYSLKNFFENSRDLLVINSVETIRFRLEFRP